MGYFHRHDTNGEEGEAMQAPHEIGKRLARAVRAAALLGVGIAAVVALACEVKGQWLSRKRPPACGHGPDCVTIDDPDGDWGGTWYWVRSPEQEKRVIMSLYDLQCARCHGVNGRGVWDIPDVPDFTDARWQECRSDAQLARLILEGRGAVMPAFRGTLTLEQAWAMARYIRSFATVPVTRPADEKSDKDDKLDKKAEKLPEPSPAGPEVLPPKPAPSPD
jgi:hypothetical protein